MRWSGRFLPDMSRIHWRSVVDLLLLAIFFILARTPAQSEIMKLETTLEVLNEMESAKVISKYAIGGAVAAFFYIEPGTTFDLDVFIAWEPAPGSLLLSNAEIFDYLFKRGYTQLEREAIVIAGWAVQFLPTGNHLLKEALEQAVPFEVGGVPTRIFTQEHLMAVCLDVGRPKDLARLLQFIDEGDPDLNRFKEILARYKLSDKYGEFEKRFLSSL